ncbi:PilZ domain-containing protein [bacterium]|nr:PilZ domain-containing protein [bacterium]
MNENKRKHERLHTHSADIKFMFGGDEKEYSAKLINISGGGTCLELDLETDSVIELSVFKPLVFDLEFEDKVIECQGQVVRVFTKHENNKTLYDFGIEFKNMSDTDVRLISDYIDENSD